MHTTTMPSIAAPVLRDRERAVVTFASWQMFALIYLQKFAVGTATFQLDVPMLIMFAGIGRMLVWRNLMFSLPRLAIYLLFVMLCLLSQSLRGGLRYRALCNSFNLCLDDRLWNSASEQPIAGFSIGSSRLCFFPPGSSSSNTSIRG